MKALIACLLLIGCASGSVVEVEETPPIEVKRKINLPKPIEPVEEGTEYTAKCRIKIYSENGCQVYVFHCQDVPTREEVVCAPPPVWPWEMEPNPVIYGN